MFYRNIKNIIKPLGYFLYRLKVTGRENEPDTPYIAIANHSSFIDPVLMLIALKKQIRFVARSSLIRFKIYRWLFAKLKVITINRGKSDLAAIKEIVSASKAGDCIGIFPQGTRLRYIKPVPDQAEAGIGLITSLSQVPILPVTIKTKRYCPGFFRKTEIIIGKPIMPDEYLNCCDEPRKKEIAEYCFSFVCKPFETDTSGNNHKN